MSPAFVLDWMMTGSLKSFVPAAPVVVWVRQAPTRLSSWQGSSWQSPRALQEGVPEEGWQASKWRLFFFPLVYDWNVCISRLWLLSFSPLILSKTLTALPGHFLAAYTRIVSL